MDKFKIENSYTRSNLVWQKMEELFLAISGREFDLATALRLCGPIEWRKRGSATTGCLEILMILYSNWTIIA